ncbi:NAD-dependent epimerase/dehydratase family protein [Mammaliicoccus sciuri]|uniref:NAD-dependent epimerase/dehydratase family protein n=1 Tax=Mammaliicoccus sciuri TaxID=1296 RepID=UPI00194F9E55|nr:NAD-dependent epimerase/dehydratase family protein [Mammaliicoccus sciuri]MDT0702582.1 NAD-dependent epimerase/dehydratase family protein [Mammaliicoccus sciuri]
MKILITGGAGFIGSNTAEYFHNNGHEVYILDNLSTGKIENIPFVDDDHFFNMDIREYSKVESLIKEYQFDVIIHFAAVVSVVDTVADPVTSNEVNIDATLKLLEFNREHNNNIKKIVFASSAAIYGNDPSLPKNINSAVKPESPYAIQKYAGEQYLKIYSSLYGLPTVALRFFNVYGPKQDPKSPYSGVLSIMKDRFDTDGKFIINGDGLQTRDFVYVKDIVKAITIVINSDEATGNIYNVGSGKANTLLTMFETFKNNYNKEIEFEFADERLGDVKHSLADISDLQKLGYSPEYDVNKGMSEYLTIENKKIYEV